MKNILLSLSAVMLAFPLMVQAAEDHHDHGAAALHSIELNAGKKWGTDDALRHGMGEIRSLGYPVVLGVSRKSFIGYSLNLPPGDRLEGTAAAASIGITRGADIIRVHDVPFMVRVANMADAITRR